MPPLQRSPRKVHGKKIFLIIVIQSSETQDALAQHYSVDGTITRAEKDPAPR